MDRDDPPYAAAPKVIGGRYGLSSKEMTPSMIKPIFEELAAARPKRHFTVGIYDDVTHLSLPIDGTFRIERPAGEVQAIFFGLGSDGTVGANKASVKIIGESTDLFAQGYFVYDSKKSGSITVSHLRFGPQPIRSTYLVEQADFVACHQFGMLGRTKVLESARHGATFLLNAPYGPEEVWDHLPGGVQRLLIEKEIDFWVIDALAVADEAGMGSRINTVMQPCFFKLAGILPPEEAIAQIKAFVQRTYAKRGEAVVARNFAAIDRSLERLGHVTLGGVTNEQPTTSHVPDDVPDFVARITSRLMAGDGDQLPVSALPVDGTFPTGTARYEKRAIAQAIPIWDPAICIDCGKCAMVCPHATIRMKVFPTASVESAPVDFLHKEFRSRELPEHRLTIQVAPDDCTGCGVCVDVCPAKSKTDSSHKAINMEPVADHRDVERERWDFFQSIPRLDRDLLPHDTVKGTQVLEPLFEFSGACGGCGETPYIRLVSQLFGDRMIVANATGCSSIYGANLPTTPWTVDGAGRGPAWSNSLFEDNAEFGLGMRLALDAQTDQARRLLERLAPEIGEDLARELLDGAQDTEAEIVLQRERVGRLRDALGRIEGPAASDARHLLALANDLVRQGVWIIGGDGWAYDIGFGGVDQVLSSGRNVNILVLDTEVYSNTGGQSSKATPRGAVAKFAAAGKGTAKKDLGAIARSYGNVYVAQVSMGANDLQTTKALLEADAWPGPSLVIAYSTCIAHGIDMSKSMSHQKDAVKSGYWPLYRFQPSEVEGGKPFKLDSPRRRSRSPTSWRPRRASPSCSGRTRNGPPNWPCWPRPMPTNAGATTNNWRGSNAPCRISVDPTPRSSRRSSATRATTTRVREQGHDRRPSDPLPRAGAPLADRRLGGAAQRGPGHGPAARTRGRRRDRPAVAVRGGDPGRGARADPLARTGHGGLRRGARLFPRCPLVHRRRGPISGRSCAGQGRRRSPDHRQPECEQRGRLGDACAAHPGRRGGRARAQPVPRCGGSAAVGGRDGSTGSRSHRGGSRLDHDPAGGQAQPVLLGVRQLRFGGHRASAPTGSCCSIVSTSRTSTWNRSRWCRDSS